MTEILYVEAPLAAVDDPSNPIRRGPTRRRPIPWDERHDRPEAPDHYAPIRFPPRCIDGTGYARRHHDWDRDGRCVFCSRRRTWEPL